MIAESRHDLRFGDLDWKGWPAAAGYRMHALAEGASLGNAVSIEQSLASQLLDGSVSRITRYDNRTVTFDVMVEADDSVALALGGAALALACDNPTTLLFTPPDGMGAPTYFEVVTANADWQFDDLDELNLRRRYRVTINCLPFGKSAEQVTDSVDPVSSPAAEETVNNCDSLTGFTGLLGSTASLDTTYKSQGTGSVKLTGQPRTNDPDSEDRARPRETGTVELTGLSLTTPATRPYIMFDGYVGNSSDASATLLVNGVEATFVSMTLVNASWATFTFRTDVTATITSLQMSETITGPAGVIYHPLTDTWVNVPASWAPRVDNIRRSGSATTNARQSLRAIPVRGSARTQGSLAVSHATLGLGKVLLLTSPSLSTGFTPDLIKWCTESTTVDANSISGKVKAFTNSNTPIPFEFPAALIPPGGYQLIGFMETGTIAVGNAAIVVTASTKVGGVTLSTVVHQQRIDATGDGVFEFVDCGPITLPTTDVPAGSAATVLLSITPAAADFLAEGEITDVSSARFQEFYLIPLADDTALNIFDCGTTGTATLGTANNRLWIDSATLGSGNPSAWLGTQEDRTDAYHAVGSAMRWRPLSLTPPEVLLFMANSGGENAVADLTHTPSWHGLAAE